MEPSSLETPYPAVRTPLAYLPATFTPNVTVPPAPIQMGSHFYPNSALTLSTRFPHNTSAVPGGPDAEESAPEALGCPRWESGRVGYVRTKAVIGP